MAKALPVYAVNPQGALLENAPLILHTRLEEMYRFVPYIADPARTAELHNMRIAAKRLRYTMEIFAPCFPGREFPKIYDQVKSIQEQIGEIHDADVRGPLFQGFVDTHADQRPEIRVGLEALARAEQAKRAKLYQEFLAYWSNLQKRGFKQRFLQMLVRAEAPPVPEKETTDEEHSQEG
ncbi:MAG: CHAD domain-containing protein [Armatimonadetes bacterium]|nr:CHAD domain-containing protein [Armatimonadota bacterium]